MMPSSTSSPSLDSAPPLPPHPPSAVPTVEEVYAEGADFTPGGELLVSLSDLQELKDIMDAKYEADGGMRLEDFLEHFGTVVRRRNRHVTDEDLALLFMRIDANANHSVDWDELSTFLLMSTEKEAIRQNAADAARVYAHVPLEQGGTKRIPELKLLAHEGTVRHIFVDPSNPGRYITHDDVSLKYWDASTIRHVRTPHYSRAAITAVVPTPQWNSTVGVACMDSTISFYALDTGDLDRAFIGQRRSAFAEHTTVGSRQQRRIIQSAAALYRTIRRPTYAVGLNSADEKRLHFGDRHSEAGNVDVTVPVMRHFLADKEIEATVLFDLGWNVNSVSGAKWKGFPTAFDVAEGVHFGEQTHLFVGLQSGVVQRYNLTELRRDKQQLGLPCLNYEEVHRDWVSRLRFVPQLVSLISASWDSTLEVRPVERFEEAGTILGSRAHHSLDAGEAHGHTRRVTAFDYHVTLKSLASCAAGEREVLLWSPHISHPLLRLAAGKGHLRDVFFRQDNTQLVTLSDDATVRIWDMRTYRCITTLNLKKQASLRATARDDGPTLQCVAYDDAKDAVVSAAHAPLVWPAARNEFLESRFEGHRKPIVALAVAPQFGQLISVDSTSIAVWNVFTGASVIRWERDPVTDDGATIVDAVIDHHQRRLVACLSNGTVVVYNYINTFILKRCLPPGVMEAEFRDLMDKLPDLTLSEAELKARSDFLKQQLLNRPHFVLSRGGRHLKKESRRNLPAATSVGFAAQVKPREVFAIVTATTAGTAYIHIDEDGGERQPQRVISLGGIALAIVPMPNSIIVFAMDTGVASFSLEEVGTKAQHFIGLVSPSLPTMCAIFEGQLQPDPVETFEMNEADRQESFNMAPSDRRSHSIVHGSDDALFRRRRSLSEYHKMYRHAPGSPNVGAHKPGHVRTSGDLASRVLLDAQAAVDAITECAAPLYLNREAMMVATATAEGTIHFWDVRLQRETLRFRASTAPGDGVYALASDLQHQLLATGDLHGYVSIFDVDRVGTSAYAHAPVEEVVFLLKRWRAHATVISSVAFVTSTAPASGHATPKLSGAGRVTVQSVYGDTNLLATASTDCLVLLWRVNGTPLRSFGDGSGSLPAPLGHAYSALVTMDLVRSNELYAFIEEFEGCTLRDIFDDFLGEGHPFGGTDDDDGGGAPAPHHGGDLGHDMTPPPPAHSTRRSVVTLSGQTPEDHSASTPQPLTSASGHSPLLSESDAAPAFSNPHAASRVSVTMSVSSSVAARTNARQAELAAHEAHLARCREWKNCTRRSFAPGTYTDLHVGRLIRRLLRDMSRYGPGLNPCIIHRHGRFFVRTEELSKQHVTRGAALGPSALPFSASVAGASQDAGGASLRFSATALGAMGETRLLEATSAFEAVVEVQREPRHVARFGLTPRVLPNRSSAPREAMRLIGQASQFNRKVSLHSVSRALDGFGTGSASSARGNPSVPVLLNGPPSSRSPHSDGPVQPRPPCSARPRDAGIDICRFVTARRTTPEARGAQRKRQSFRCGDSALGFDALFRRGRFEGPLPAASVPDGSTPHSLEPEAPSTTVASNAPTTLEGRDTSADSPATVSQRVSPRNSGRGKVHSALRRDASGADVVSTALRAAIEDREASVQQLRALAAAHQSELNTSAAEGVSGGDIMSPGTRSLSTASRPTTQRKLGGKRCESELVRGLGDDDLIKRLDAVGHGLPLSWWESPPPLPLRYCGDADDDDEIQVISSGSLNDTPRQSDEDDEDDPVDTAAARRARIARKRRLKQRSAMEMLLSDTMAKVTETVIGGGDNTELKEVAGPLLSTRIAAAIVKRLLRSVECTVAAPGDKDKAASPVAASANSDLRERRRSEVVRLVLGRAGELAKDLTANIELLSEADAKHSAEPPLSEWETDSLVSVDERRTLHVEQQLARAAAASQRDADACDKQTVTHGFFWIAQTHSRLLLFPPTDPVIVGDRFFVPDRHVLYAGVPVRAGGRQPLPDTDHDTSQRQAPMAFNRKRSTSIR